jgi:hypothetical protein
VLHVTLSSHSMSVPEVPPEFDELSTSEKIEYVQQLWDCIADEVDSDGLTARSTRQKSDCSPVRTSSD